MGHSGRAEMDYPPFIIYLPYACLSEIGRFGDMDYTAWILLTAALVGLSCGLIGVFLILRRMAMMADAISHTVLLGIVVAFLITNQLSGPHMLVGAVIAGLVTAFLPWH